MTTTEQAYQPAAPGPSGPTPGEPHGRSAAARALLVIGAVLAALIVLRVALFLVDLAVASTTTQHESYAAASTVELVADGDVTVRTADGGVEVDRIAHSSLASPTYRADESADRLVVRHECTGWTWLVTRCSGELAVTVPPDTELVVRTSNGDVLASGVAGDVELGSSNGEVAATSIDGTLDAHTSNGGVEIAGVTGDVDAHSSNGGIEVSDVGGSLEVETSNGDIDVDGVAGSAVAVSSNGTVEVAGVAGDARAESSNGDVTVTGDGEPVKLVIDTSNGNQTIEGATDPEASRTVEVRSSNGDVSYLVR